MAGGRLLVLPTGPHFRSTSTLIQIRDQIIQQPFNISTYRNDDWTALEGHLLGQITGEDCSPFFLNTIFRLLP